MKEKDFKIEPERKKVQLTDRIIIYTIRRVSEEVSMQEKTIKMKA